MLVGLAGETPLETSLVYSSTNSHFRCQALLRPLLGPDDIRPLCNKSDSYITKAMSRLAIALTRQAPSTPDDEPATCANVAEPRSSWWNVS